MIEAIIMGFLRFIGMILGTIFFKILLTDLGYYVGKRFFKNLYRESPCCLIIGCVVWAVAAFVIYHGVTYLQTQHAIANCQEQNLHYDIATKTCLTKPTLPTQ